MERTGDSAHFLSLAWCDGTKANESARHSSMGSASSKMTQTKSWKNQLKQKGWTSRYMNSKEAKVFMEDQLRRYEQFIQGEQAVK